MRRWPPALVCHIRINPNVWYFSCIGIKLIKLGITRILVLILPFGTNIYVLELVNKKYGGTIPRMIFTYQQALEVVKKDSVMAKSCQL